jgi:predicted dehydrogenase
VLRIAIVGCGKVADQHVQAIHRIPSCKIVALCDRELLLAKQLGERFGIAACFSELSKMLETAHPDVVHISTPPQSHYSLANQCLESGINVYLEKPFTITAEEAESVVELAERRGLKVTVGHNYQFTLEMREMRRLLKEGFLGGRPSHLESYWSYDLADLRYASAFLSNRAHWVRQLPGQLFHNLISHGIAKLAEFLDEVVEIIATAYQSDHLRSLGVENVLDELRVLLRDKHGTTAFFCFSTQIKRLNQLRIYGPVNSIIADIITGSLFRNPNRLHKSYLTYFLPPLTSAREHFRNAGHNITNFLRRRLYQDFGMKELIERFYNSIRLDKPVPIPYREIILTARIMDEIFAQIYPIPTTDDTQRRSDIGGRTAEDRGRIAGVQPTVPSPVLSHQSSEC